MAESEEKLKSLLMKVKEESDKVGLKLHIQKTKIILSSPITSWQIEGGKVETEADFIFLGSKITMDGDCSPEIKRHLLLGRKVTDTTYSVATTSTNGLMSAADKAKLDGMSGTLAEGANIELTTASGTTTIALADTVTTGEVIADEVQTGDLVVTGEARFTNTINGDISGNAATVNNHSVNTDVPSNAVFTDTTYSFGSGSANGTIKYKSSSDSGYTDVAVTGLGSAAYKDVPTSGNAGATQVVKGDDTRLTDSRTPTSHSHGNIANGGTISSAAVTPANNDYILISDASNSGKVERGIAIGTDTTKYLRNDGTWVVPPNDNTTYTFADGTNGFTVTPSGGTAQTVTVTPSIANNVTGSGTSNKLAKWNGINTITDGPGYTTSVTKNSSDLVTSGAVWTAIDVLPEPMVFKGTVGTNGTVENLPTASSATLGYIF